MDFFDFNGIKITVIVDQNGEPWWIAKEACNVLGLANVAMAVKNLDDDEKNSITLSDLNQRGTPKRIIINEPGLYNLIGKSTKPEAKLFSRWIAKEACDVLDLANVARAVKHLDADEKNTITLSNTNRRGSPKRTIINEPGLYHLIAKSKKPEAKKFARWIRHDVLPAIRKTGSYSIKPKIEVPKEPHQQIPPGAQKTQRGGPTPYCSNRGKRETYRYKYRLVERISMALKAYRQQKNRMADIMDQMKRIVSGG